MGWGVVGEMGNKAISSFNSVEVEVEDELGNRKPINPIFYAPLLSMLLNYREAILFFIENNR